MELFKILVFNWRCWLNPAMGGAEVFTCKVASVWSTGKAFRCQDYQPCWLWSESINTSFGKGIWVCSDGSRGLRIRLD